MGEHGGSGASQEFPARVRRLPKSLRFLWLTRLIQEICIPREENIFTPGDLIIILALTENQMSVYDTITGNLLAK